MAQFCRQKNLALSCRPINSSHLAPMQCPQYIHMRKLRLKTCLHCKVKKLLLWYQRLHKRFFSYNHFLLRILHEFVQKTPTMEEKKHQKDLQDICQKALESVSAIAGSSLEQTTWLRRNFAVKPGPQIEGGEEAETQEDRGMRNILKQ